MVSDYELSQNYPNPFNPETRINYAILENSVVTIEIFNITGQLIRTLINEYKAKGNYSVIWDGRDNAGRLVSSGIYLYRLQAGSFIQTRKMIFMK